MFTSDDIRFEIIDNMISFSSYPVARLQRCTYNNAMGKQNQLIGNVDILVAFIYLCLRGKYCYYLSIYYFFHEKK